MKRKIHYKVEPVSDATNYTTSINTIYHNVDEVDCAIKEAHFHMSEDNQGEVSFIDTDISSDYQGISRNALCPCGSGKKYKRCHGIN